MFAVIKKELKSYFYTPIGYIFIALFLAVLSYVFYYYFYFHRTLHFEYIIAESTYVLSYLIPILTMRLFSEEKKTGTDQLIITSPKSIVSIVIGKFLAATIVTLIACLSTFVYYGFLSKFGKVSLVEPLVAMLGFMLLSMSYISFGMFISSLTESQVIAAVVSIGFFLIISLLQSTTGIISMFSLTEMYQKFPLGIIALKELIGYITFTCLFTLLTIIVLQRRKSVR